MEERRKLLRIEVDDFLNLIPLNEVATIKGKSRNLTPMGICFSSEIEWKKGQLLYIDYYIPQINDSIKIKVVVVWSEFIDQKIGYFCGGEIIEVEKEKEEKFVNYYFQKLNKDFK
ncbi:MAG: hypothetical protein QXZ20_03890 [Candidatus Aenigmatarchaeota archaeon]